MWCFDFRYFIWSDVWNSIIVRKNNGDIIDTWVVGGDGRYPGVEFLPKIIKYSLFTNFNNYKRN